MKGCSYCSEETHPFVSLSEGNVSRKTAEDDMRVRSLLMLKSLNVFLLLIAVDFTFFEKILLWLLSSFIV
jgi:hypothetical protein